MVNTGTLLVKKGRKEHQRLARLLPTRADARAGRAWLMPHPKPLRADALRSLVLLKIKKIDAGHQSCEGPSGPGRALLSISERGGGIEPKVRT